QIFAVDIGSASPAPTGSCSTPLPVAGGFQGGYPRQILAKPGSDLILVAGDFTLLNGALSTGVASIARPSGGAWQWRPDVLAATGITPLADFVGPRQWSYNVLSTGLQGALYNISGSYT